MNESFRASENIDARSCLAAPSMGTNTLNLCLQYGTPFLRRLELVPFDAAVAVVHAQLWARLAETGQMIGPHDLIVAATAVHRRWAVATFNAAEFRHVHGHGLGVIEP